MSHQRPVYNYPLPDPCYDIRNRSTPMSPQRSTSSTDSNWSHSSVASYQSNVSSQHHSHSRHTANTHGAMQRSSHNASHGERANSQYAEKPTSPSEKSDGEPKEKQYCLHADCHDAKGRPISSFSRKADVSRHYKSTHEKQFINCPWPKCSRRDSNGFTRMDHLKEHRISYHKEKIAKRQNSNDVGSHDGY